VARQRLADSLAYAAARASNQSVAAGQEQRMINVGGISHAIFILNGGCDTTVISLYIKQLCVNHKTRYRR
jgi:hypothetical protein